MSWGQQYSRDELAPYEEQERLREAQEGQLAEEAREANAQAAGGQLRQVVIRGVLAVVVLVAAVLIIVYLVHR
jgi:hypothetical protein